MTIAAASRARYRHHPNDRGANDRVQTTVVLLMMNCLNGALRARHRCANARVDGRVTVGDALPPVDRRDVDTRRPSSTRTRRSAAAERTARTYHRRRRPRRHRCKRSRRRAQARHRCTNVRRHTADLRIVDTIAMTRNGNIAAARRRRPLTAVERATGVAVRGRRVREPPPRPRQSSWRDDR
jgi:hypothetical protein